MDLVADGDESAVEVQALLAKSMSGHFRPRTSLRRIPVIGVSHTSGNSRCPAAVRMKLASSSSVRDALDPLEGPLLRELGDDGHVAGDSPRRSASASAPLIMRWISYTVFGARARDSWSGAGAAS